MNDVDFIKSGCSCLDKALKGGFPINCLSLIYGGASVGKTTMGIQCSAEVAKKDFKVLFIDSDHTFSPQRLSQIIKTKIDVIGDNILILSPEDFDDQTKIIENLESYITAKVRLIVLDSVSSLYRESLGTIKESYFLLNRELNRQLAYLSELSINYELAVIVTSQIHSIFDEGNWRIEPVAFRILSYWCNIILNLESTSKWNMKKAIIERYLVEEDRREICMLAITDNGFKNMDFQNN